MIIPARRSTADLVGEGGMEGGRGEGKKESRVSPIDTRNVFSFSPIF